MLYVYLLKNIQTGRTYVGRSCHPDLRFRQHMNNLKSHKHPILLMQSDFDKYGEKSFEFEIVDEFKEFSRNDSEIQWMMKLKTYDKKYGYNYKDPHFLYRGHIPTKQLLLSVEELLEERK